MGTLIVLEAVMEKTSPASCRASDDASENFTGCQRIILGNGQFLVWTCRELDVYGG
jgi:hypothetical protein